MSVDFLVQCVFEILNPDDDEHLTIIRIVEKFDDSTTVKEAKESLQEFHGGLDTDRAVRLNVAFEKFESIVPCPSCDGHGTHGGGFYCENCSGLGVSQERQSSWD